MSASENGGSAELAYQPVPPFPWAVDLTSVRYYDPRFDEAGELVEMVIVVCPAVPMPPEMGGVAPMPPAVKIHLSAEGWERLKVEVANDGKRPKPSGILVAGPGDLPDGAET